MESTDTLVLKGIDNLLESHAKIFLEIEEKAIK